MAQVIKLKRSAVTGKTPQTSSLQLGELAVNTTDGKIYLHRSSSGDDSIQSVLTTDATITGSLKLSGSQHISGSVGVMDDITFIGDMSSSLTSTSSFSRLISVATASIGYLEVTGSNFAVFDAETGSFASSSDVQQILDESGSYLVDADTGSLGKVTLISDITGSITSTGSFGKIFGDGSDLDNVADPAAISGSYLGLLSGSHDLTLGLGVSGSLTSTASFGTLELTDVTGLPFATGSDLHQILAESSSYVLEQETGSFASGSDLQVILAESASYVVSTNTGSFVVNSQTSSFASGSDLQIIQAESASYVVSTNTSSFLQNADTASLQTVGIHDTLFVSGNITTSGSVIAKEFKTEFISSSIIYSSGSNEFGDTIDDTHIFTGSILLTGSLTMDTGSITLTDGHITGSILSTGSFGKLFGDGGSLTNVADPDAISGSFQGGGSDTISGSLISTASFGTLELVNSHGFVRSTETGSFASGSDLQVILAESSSYVTLDETGSFASGSDLQIIQAESASYVTSISTGSLNVMLAESASYVVSTNTGSFVVNSQTGSFASGSDIQIIKAESASYVVSTNTGSFVVNSQTGSFASGSNVQTILDDYAKGTEISGSYLGLLSGSDDLTLGLGVSGSLLSTGSFGNLKLVNYGGLPFASGSDLHQFFAESASYVTSISTGSLNVMLAESASYLFNASTASLGDLTLVGDITGALGESASFDRLEAVTLNASISPFASGSDVSQIQAQTGSYASGSDLHQFLAESASYVTSISTSSLHQVLAESASYLNNDTTSSFGAVSMNSTLFVQGNISTSGSITANEYIVNSSVTNVTQSFSSGSTIFGDTIDDTHKFTGSLFVSGNINLPDSTKLNLGSDDDANIKHTGTNLQIQETTGNIQMTNYANDKDIVLSTDDGSGGTTAYITLDGSATKTIINKSMRFADDIKALFGAGQDLQIYHDGSHNYFDINNGNIYFRDDADNNIFLIYREGNGVQLAEGNITIPATSKVIFDGATSGHSHIAESAADIMDFTVGGVRMLRLDEGNDLTTITGSLNIETSASVSYLEITGSSSDLNRIQVANGSGLYSKLASNERSSVQLIKYDTGNQTLVGGNTELTLAGGTIVNDFGNAVDFRVESGDNTHAIFLDDSADALGIFTANPTSELTVEGAVSASGNFITTATGSVGRLNFDGEGGHTFIQETADDTLKIIVGGEAKMEFAEDSENIFMQANNYNFRDASFNNTFKIEANNHLLSGSLTSTGSFGRVHTPGTIKSDNRLEIGSNSNFLTDQLKVSDGTRDIRLNANHSSNAVVGTVGSHDFNLMTNNTFRATIASGGNIGIGTSHPSGALHIFASDGLEGTTPETDGDNFIIESNADTGLSIISGESSGETGAVIFGHASDSFAAGLVYQAHTNQLSLQTQQVSNTIRIATGNNDESFIFSGYNISGSITSTGSLGRIETTTAGVRIGGYKSEHNYPLEVEGHAYVRGPDGWNGNGDLAIVALGSHAVNENFGVGYKYGTGMILSIYKSGGNGSFGSSTADAITIADTSGDITLLDGADITGSIASTASFGKIVADQYSLATLTEVSGGLTSTGSFGHLVVANGINAVGRTELNGSLVVDTGIVSSKDETLSLRRYEVTNNSIDIGDGQQDFKMESRQVLQLNASTTTGFAGISGSLTMSGSILPLADNNAAFDLGSSSKRWNDVFAVQTTVGAVFEVGLRSKGIGKEETGTIVVWRNGKLVPCDKSEDTMVMGVIKEGKDEPIVMGAEPVLVTGDVKEGDFITTSTKSGHGKKLENGYLLKKEMFGKVIAQALEDSSGESSLIKCMIRKM